MCIFIRCLAWSYYRHRSLLFVHGVLVASVDVLELKELNPKVNFGRKWTKNSKNNNFVVFCKKIGDSKIVKKEAENSMETTPTEPPAAVSSAPADSSDNTNGN